MRRAYRRPGLELRPRTGPADPLVKVLQEDLRALGYRRAGIDGRFGDGTGRAVRALQYDLLTAERHGSDGDAPVALLRARRSSPYDRLLSMPGAPLYRGAPETPHPTRYHPETSYTRVPERATLGCDWPYAVRRYNGSGVDSYHYQYQVLGRLTRLR
jgi:peptidoglycan hydrolase-like protein with peptidoglycan-binding domain